MGRRNRRSMDFRHYKKWAINRFLERTTTTKNPIRILLKHRRSLKNVRRNSISARKVCNKRGSSTEDKRNGLLQPSICGSKERREETSSYRLQKTKRKCSEISLQNGRSDDSSRSYKTRRLDGSDRLKGRISACSDSPAISKVSPISISRKTLPIPMHALWPHKLATSLYENNEKNLGKNEKTRNESRNLFRRHSYYGGNKGDVGRSHAQFSSASSKAWTHSKLGEVSSDTNAKYRVSGNRYDTNGLYSSNKTSEQHASTLRKTLEKSKDIPTRIGRSDRKINLCGTGSNTRNFKDTKVVKMQEQQSARRLGGNSNSEQSSLRRSRMVDRKYQELERKSNHTSNDRNLPHFGRLKTWMGRNKLTRSKSKGLLVGNGTKLWEQRKRTSSGMLYPEILRKNGSGKSGGTIYGQHNSSIVHKQYGGKREFPVGNSGKYLGLVSRKENQPKCEISTRNNELGGGQAVKDTIRQKRLDVESENISRYRSDMGASRNGSVRFKTQQPNPKIHIMGTRPRSNPLRCTVAELERSKRMGKPTFHSYFKNPTESQERKIYNHSGHSSLVHSTLVPNPSKPSNRLSDNSAKQLRPIRPRISEKQNSTKPTTQLESDRMAYIRKREDLKGVSHQVIDFMSRSGDGRTSVNYSSAWRKFAKWFNEKKFIDSVVSPARVADFLYEQYLAGASYSHINNLRSAISSTAPKYQGVRIGQHEIITTIMSRMERERPPEPKYDEIWNLDQVVDYVQNKWPNNSVLSLQDIRSKAAVLVTIAIMGRSSDVQRIIASSLIEHNEYLNYRMKPPKNYTRGSSRIFKLDKVNEKPSICPVRALLEYVKRTESQRKTENIFLDVNYPYKPLTSQRIAKIVLEVMKLAGINTSIYKTHSIRSATASKAIESGLSVDEVMKKGRWKSRGVFQRFYDRANLKQNFSKTVLSGFQ